MSTITTLQQRHVRWAPTLPVVGVCVLWLREAAWFRVLALPEAFAIVAFVLGTGMLVWLLASVAFAKLPRSSLVMFFGIVLAVVVLVVAREVVRQLVAAGYSDQHHAYTSLLPLVASKRGLSFVVALGFVPLLLSVFTVLLRSPGRAAAAASMLVAAVILAASVYVAAT